MKHINAIKCVGNRAKQKCFHFLRKQFCLSNNNKQEMQIRKKKEAKKHIRDGRNCRLGPECKGVTPLPLIRDLQLDQANRTYILYLL